MDGPIDGFERNIHLFPRYKAATSVLPYLPVFFLFFLERVSLADAVLLGSISYFSIFILEVPSGYCSDRYGRRPTLIIASIMKVLACTLFVVANSLEVLVAAQVLMAASTAFQSGSDSALLFDSLRALGREDEYTESESRAQKWSMTALAISCLIGGAIGIVDLRLPYAATLLAAAAAVVLSARFVEPPLDGESVVAGFFSQLREASTSLI